MRFLCIPGSSVGRTPSTEEFASEEDRPPEPPEPSETTSGDDVVFSNDDDQSLEYTPTQRELPAVAWKSVKDEEGGSESNRSSQSWISSNKIRLQLYMVTLTVVCIGLAMALGTLIVLRTQSKPANETIEVCDTKLCKRTANLFLRSMDEDVDPCDDFPAFACGNWLKETASTTSKGSYDHTTVMRDRIIGRLRKLTEKISEEEIEPLKQIKKMYESCTNVDTLEDIGLEPLAKLLNDLVLPNMSLATSLAFMKRATGQSYVFDFAMNPDYRNPKMNSIFIDQPQLPADGSAFLSAGNLEEAYRKLINEAFKRLHTVPGVHPIITTYMKNGSQIIMDFEKQLAEALTDIHTLPKASMFNLLSLRDLNLMFANATEAVRKENSQIGYEVKGIPFNWTEYATVLFHGIPGAHVNEKTYVNVNDVSYLKSLAKILANSTEEHVRVYLTWQLIYSFGKDVTRDFRSLFYAFSQKIDGSETTPNRFTECINLLDTHLPFALTYRYIQNYVPDEIIEEAYEMVQYLSMSFKRMVSSLDWMDKMTKHRALLKAGNMRAFMGYPSWMKNESAVIHYHKGLNMSNMTFFENVLTMQQWLTKKYLSKLSKPVDTTWSSDSPAEADAFYDDELNAITFPSGFLQEPFFGMGLRSVDYGALGSVIGHEITHGFDTRGRFSDESGRLKSWWSVPTLKTFVKKAQCFVHQYNQYTAPEAVEILGNNSHVNGKRTLAENIADNGGIREAFQAYKFYVKGRHGKPEPRLPGLEKFTPEQLFFLSFAQSWCSYSNPKALSEALQGNEHSPSRFRIIGSIANFDEFSKVWQCKANSKMNPPHKCVLW